MAMQEEIKHQSQQRLEEYFQQVRYFQWVLGQSVSVGRHIPHQLIDPQDNAGLRQAGERLAAARAAWHEAFFLLQESHDQRDAARGGWLQQYDQAYLLPYIISRDVTTSP